jgi:hypothetical protein
MFYNYFYWNLFLEELSCLDCFVISHYFWIKKKSIFQVKGQIITVRGAIGHEDRVQKKQYRGFIEDVICEGPFRTNWIEQGLPSSFILNNRRQGKNDLPASLSLKQGLLAERGAQHPTPTTNWQWHRVSDLTCFFLFCYTFFLVSFHLSYLPFSISSATFLYFSLVVSKNTPHFLLKNPDMN